VPLSLNRQPVPSDKRAHRLLACFSFLSSAYITLLEVPSQLKPEQSSEQPRSVFPHNDGPCTRHETGNNG